LISHRYLRRIDDDPEARILLQRLQNEGYRCLKNIWIERVFRLENGSETHTDQLDPLLCNPVAEKLTKESTLNPQEGPIFEVGYQRAVTDPETFSILRGARSLGVNSLNWARIAHRYQFIGLNQEEAKEIVSHYLYNPQVQVIIQPGEKWDSLKPRGETGWVKSVSLEGLSDRELQQLSDRRRLFLDNRQMKVLQQIAGHMKRNMTDAELEMFAQTWSDHCFHTTWKSLGLLKLLQDATRSINHPLVLSMFEDNAGVMDFYNGWALTIKGETHNSPTAVSPYGGIMTKHGGVIRDTLGCGQGAWPIGGSTVMGLGDPRLPWNEVPDGALHPKTILLDAIRGTADYCNPMGIPMMFPVYRFHPGYTGKCFALGHSIGLIPSKRAKKGRPQPGDLAILIGGKTGRDGLHGATVSSASMTSETASVDAAHVQIGHPIQERKFMEAIPALRDQDCLHAITDLGAAGLSSAAGEMGADTGIWINLAWVPLKTEGLFPWEIWISESQERMLLCVPPEKCERGMKLLERYEVPASVIGKFTDSQRCQVIFDPDLDKDFSRLPISPQCTGEQVVDLFFHDLRKGCPLPQIELHPTLNRKNEVLPADCRSPNDVKSAIVRLLSHLNCSDQSAAGTQFDNTIQGNIVMGPYGGKGYRMPNDLWVSAPIRGEAFGAAASIAYNPFYGDVNPAGLAKLMMIESISKLVGAGVDHREIVLCDNFYTPRVTPQVAFALKEMLQTCSALSKQFGTPFISGKDSSSGTFINQENQRINAPFSLCIMAMGRMPDVRHLVTKPFKSEGNPLYLLGPLSDRLGGSVYLDTLGTRGMHLPDPDPKILLDLWNQLSTCRKGPPLLSVSPIGEGGLMHRVFEMSLGSEMGCRIDLEKIRKTLSNRRLDCALFAEMIGAWIIEVTADSVEYIESRLPVTAIGSVTQDNTIHLHWDGAELKLKMDELIEHWEQPFREVAL
jgi:phosphoribosylformylglycinamidine synthase II